MIGVDVSTLASVDVWNCLIKDGFGQDPVQMAVPRIWNEHIDDVDTVGINSAKNAIDAGVKEVGGYVFPCLGKDDAGDSCSPAKD